MSAAKAIFVGGTASHVGKSWFVTALCRVLRRRGVSVVPFKAQNMSNNSCPCIEGGEIGRAQAVQAEACGVPPMADMNPVLLKPNSTTGSQVVLHGRPWLDVEAAHYGGHSDFLFGEAMRSFHRLAARHDYVVCEGAGSVAEMNLLPRDITNLRVAEAVNAKALLVADIERGGVFASLAGTLELLPPGQRRLVRAFAVNRFRGDPRLFDDGVTFLEARMGVPCLGVFPLDPAIRIDDEDTLSLDDVAGAPEGRDVAVVRLPRISNFTDFNALGAVDWVATPNAPHQYRAVILPGTKNTIEDLGWLRAAGLDRWIGEQHAGGARIVGICGGYQMLGEAVEDPDHVESASGFASGLGMLPVRTVLQSPKITRAVGARTPGGIRFRGYEIHMGRTVVARDSGVFATLDTGELDGCVSGRVMGTYLHGAFDDPAAVAEYLGVEGCATDRESQYDALADWLVRNAHPAVLEELLG